jgi:hypothetical protein
MCFISITFVTCAQNKQEKDGDNERYANFVNSFREDNSIEIKNFRKLSFSKDYIDKIDATQFIYNGDSTKLYCVESYYSDETEESGVLGTFLWLPSKSLRINFDKYYLIAYTYYQCQDDDYTYMNLDIVDKNYNKKDSMIIYKGDEYDSEILGCFNSNSNKIFLLKTENGKQAFLYSISKDLHFEIIKESLLPTNTDIDNLMQVLEILEWKEYFLET